MSRGLNIRNGNNNLISTADMCGQKILGTNGSLTSWINTGNAGTLDSFVANPKRSKAKQKKKADVLNIIKGIIIALGVAASGVLIFKNRAKISSFFADKIKKLKSVFKRPTDNPSADSDLSFLDKIKNIFKKKVDNIDTDANVPLTPPPVFSSAENKGVFNAVVEPKKPASAADMVHPKSVREIIDADVIPETSPVLGLPAPKVVVRPKDKPFPETPHVIELPSSKKQVSSDVSKVLVPDLTTPLAEDEMKDIINMCDYSVPPDLSPDEFEATLSQVKRALDSPAEEVAEILDAPLETPEYIAIRDEARKSAKQMQEEYWRVVSPKAESTFSSPDDALDFSKVKFERGQTYCAVDPETNVVYAQFLANKDGELIPLYGSEAPSTGKKYIIKPKDSPKAPKEGKDDIGQLIEDMKALCGDAEIIDITEDELINGVKPKFDFAGYIKGKKVRPELQRYKAESMQERLEDMQQMIRVPKKKKR